jgi:hypothetical protein
MGAAGAVSSVTVVMEQDRGKIIASRHKEHQFSGVQTSFELPFVRRIARQRAEEGE